MKRIALLAMVAASIAGPTTAQAAGCTGSGATWASYGFDAHNSRNASSNITAENAGSLAADLAIPTQGVVQNTPVLAQGCVYLATDQGIVTAHDDTGAEIWRYAPEGPFESTGGAIVGSPLYNEGRLYVAVSRTHAPFLAVLDATDGSIIAETTLDTWENNFASAAPILAGDLIFIGISGAEGEANARGGYAFTDLDGNAIDLRPNDDSTVSAYTISDEEYEAGYRGTSIWTTGAYDADEKAVFVGGGNPASKRIEHRYSNALMRIDADLGSDTFGEIVDAYKGNTDQYYPGLDRQPLCELYGEDITYAAWSLACVQFDIDFGASPNVWIDEESGRAVLGGLQKSGIYHAVWADNMQQNFTTVVGAPCVACNAASTAYDDENVYAVGTPGGVLQAFTRSNGKFRWAAPVADGAHFQSVTVTNDVVLTITTTGVVVGYDTETGVPVFVGSRPSGSGVALSSSGVAVDGDSIWVPLSSSVVRFTLA
ncbi:MAG: PQQ-binding-like beta-propeller repeat protein [Actinomycetota bacterium]